MLNIQEYVAPNSLEEAYQYLISQKGATLLGGCAYLNLGTRNIPLAIDLSRTGLSYIRENEDTIELGAMTTFGDVEHSAILARYFNNILALSVRDIVGIQLRNLVTVGGTVYSRYGFSDFITALHVLDTQVKLYKQGIFDLEYFLENGSKEPDILEKVIIKKDNRQAVFKAMRNSRGDYAILNLALARIGDKFRIVVGARPGRAALALNTMEYLNNEYAQKRELSPEILKNAGEIIAEELSFGSNGRGSSEYRKELAKVLLRKAIQEVI
ncbi:CO or xanthine dehydrogenase, FAD-binding subunit [Thermosyntropha lipolytica DSM 11003]|uniref:CO or xanthine dehydrogenase, FAD-binding subunit n=1 Tax=Thermosyntropha lipolytica DSM 11003 TaxID=1123382 RepID=A0A1M5P2T8_9FIRM|nr:FAD binding domain-containing protein [Thermosyntropha lipolytica]SHG96110.1 CO or xanthine dehydrogenase, FAD-binding subunit [Thermosyntropha lipolytica DSM 11003]